MAYLTLKQEGAQEQKFPLTKSVTSIGRSANNDIVITDRFISREHVKIISLQNGEYELQDLGARHPTQVNDAIVSSHRLKEGDSIKLGSSELIFQSGETEQAATFEEDIEVTSLDTKNTVPFSLSDLDAKDLLTLQKDHQRLMLLYEFGKAVNSFLEDPHQVLAEIMGTAFKALDAERGFIALKDENTGELTYEFIRDDSSEKELEELEISKTIVHKVVNDGVSLLTYNALKDIQFENAKSVKEYQIRSAICAPLLFRDDVLGVVYLDNRASEGMFGKDDLMFLMAMCREAGIAMRNAHLHRQVVQENIRLEKAMLPKFQIIGESESMEKIYATLKKVAPTDITVLIQGETGTGKELLARAIHTQSLRSELPFVAVNCAAIPKDLIESELFGHERGAFTGAVSTRQGKFQHAHLGTVFLDEIGDMSLATQAKVLRVLEEKEIHRIGGANPIQVDVRVIAASNKDLANAVEKKQFREDLYYRLNVVTIKIPPLRQRREDILPLALHFMGGRVKKISSRAESLLKAHQWPGNIRELRNCMERALVMGDGEIIQPEDLPYAIRKSGQVIPSPLGSLEDMEEEHLTRVLRHTQWHKSEAARILNVTRQTLDNKIAKYKIKK